MHGRRPGTGPGRRCQAQTPRNVSLQVSVWLRSAAALRLARIFLVRAWAPLLVDEVAFLSACQTDRKLKERIMAAPATLTTQDRAVATMVMY